MTTPNRWYAPTAIQTAISGASLQNLANAAGVIGTEYDNTSVLDMWFYVLVQLKYNDVTGITNGSTKVADLYLLPAVDGSTYPDTVSNVPEGGNYIASLTALAASTSAVETHAFGPFLAPPLKFKLALVNKCGQSLKNDTSSIVKMLLYEGQSS